MKKCALVLPTPALTTCGNAKTPKATVNPNIIVILAGIIPSLAAAAEKTSAPASRPNILFCIADDASYHHFGAAGCRWVDTPAFDRVASHGLFFANCYTPNAKSAPSRACILTGRYSWQLKEAGNHICNFPAEFGVFTETLASGGYLVACTGKGWAPGNPGSINGRPRQLTGEAYQQHKLKPPTKGISNNDYSANFAQFLDESGGKPWFFWFGGTEPHRSYEYGSGVAKGGRKPGDIDHVPAFWPDCEQVRNDMLDYGYEIEWFDSHIGRMLAELERRDMLHNTLVVITSDNGMPFPRSKANNYEFSHHMPLAAMWPDGVANPGRRIEDFVSFVDFAPTFLEVCGIGKGQSNMQPITGQSIMPILRSSKNGRVVASRDHILLGRERDDYGRPNNEGYPIRAIIRGELLYINNLKPDRWPAGNPETGYLDIDGSPTKSVILEMKRSGESGWFYQMSMGVRPSEELYDLAADPDCIRDLARDKAYAARKEALHKELYAALKRQGDPRTVGGGDVFDSYPFDSPDKWNFYERVVSGEVQAPWKQTRWVEPADYDAFRPSKTVAK
ncbi:heparan N-sulfatase [Bacteroidia bacterium]|nr:heparan N-sulfatase [Bacteroidia bacterium]